MAGGEGGFWLERPFEEDEVFEVVNALNKAPRPGNFIIVLLQSLLGGAQSRDNVFHDFHARGLN